MIAALVMAIPAFLGFLVDPSAMPEPVPLAMVKALSKHTLWETEAIYWAVASHFAYGGFWGAFLSLFWHRPTAHLGTGLGFFLWLVMLAASTLLLGKEFIAETGIVVFTLSTLILHLVYGYVLGWLLEQSQLY